MKNKLKSSLEIVLTQYGNSSENFDANVLNRYLIAYPKYKNELFKYAFVQLTHQAPSRQDIEAEEVDINELKVREILTKIKR